MHGISICAIAGWFFPERSKSSLLAISNCSMCIKKRERDRDEGKKLEHAALIKLIYANEASYNKLIWS